MKKLIILIATLIFSMSLLCACNPYGDFSEGEYVFDLNEALQDGGYLANYEESEIEFNTTLCGKQVDYISMRFTPISLIDYNKQKPLNVLKISKRFEVDLRIRFVGEDTPTHYDITFESELHGECLFTACINGENIGFGIDADKYDSPPSAHFGWDTENYLYCTHITIQQKV